MDPQRIDAEQTVPTPPAYDGWEHHLEHGVAELKARGMTIEEVTALVTAKFNEK